MSVSDRIKSLAPWTIFQDLHFCESATSCVKSIRKGLIFVFADWSGPSVMGFEVFAEAVGRLPKTSTLELHVLDTDSLGDKTYVVELNLHPSGAGELLWIAHGRVVGMDRSLRPSDEPYLIEKLKTFGDNEQ